MRREVRRLEDTRAIRTQNFSRVIVSQAFQQISLQGRLHLGATVSATPVVTAVPVVTATMAAMMTAMVTATATVTPGLTAAAAATSTLAGAGGICALAAAVIPAVTRTLRRAERLTDRGEQVIH